MSARTPKTGPHRAYCKSCDFSKRYTNHADAASHQCRRPCPNCDRMLAVAPVRVATDGGRSTSGTEHSETVLACPNCDRASVNHASNDEYRCEVCNATFDEPVERERRAPARLRGDSLASALNEADPGDLMTDGGTPTSGTEQYRVLDLFAGLGGFSAAFKDADNWQVTTVEIEDQFEPDICTDILDLRPSDFEEDYDVVLASPPCTQFSRVGNHDHWDHETHEPTADESRDAVALAHHTVGLIRGLSPDYWFLENPLGRLRWVLGQPTATVTYCQYGRPHMKPTDLWGDHPPMTYRRCNEGDDCHDTNRPGRDGGHGGMYGVDGYSDDSAERSLVPYDLSEVILRAVEGRSEQTTLKAVATDGGQSSTDTDRDVRTDGGEERASSSRPAFHVELAYHRDVATEQSSSLGAFEVPALIVTGLVLSPIIAAAVIVAHCHTKRALRRAKTEGSA